MENTVPASTLRQAMNRRLMRRSSATGEIRLMAVPGMIDDYVTTCDQVFAALGAQFNAEELAHLRGVLERQLAKAYAESQRSEIIISYQRLANRALEYNVRSQWLSVQATYDNWVATREPPLFGTEPDARVLALAAELGDPAGAPVLDVGAGTGRNSLALARRGHPVDAIEMTEKFAEIMATETEREGLGVRVLRRQAFDGFDDLRRDYRLIVLSEVTPDFRSTDDLRRMFELAAHSLAPGGCLLFNIFLPRNGYVPDEAARGLGQQCYSMIFTHSEVSAAAALLPLYQVGDDSVYDYERENLPPEAWPPTSWYAGWVSGLDVFDVPREDRPIEMRWLVYRKSG